MLDVFMGQCAPNAAFLPISSLNEPANDADEPSDADAPEVIDQLAAPVGTVEMNLIESETLAEITARVQAFVARLSPRLRCVALRIYWGGQSQTEIAAALGVTRSAICHAARRLERLGRSELADLATHIR